VRERPRHGWLAPGWLTRLLAWRRDRAAERLARIEQLTPGAVPATVGEPLARRRRGARVVRRVALWCGVFVVVTVVLLVGADPAGAARWVRAAAPFGAAALVGAGAVGVALRRRGLAWAHRVAGQARRRRRDRAAQAARVAQKAANRETWRQAQQRRDTQAREERERRRRANRALHEEGERESS
jgi:hypothetical protein